MKQHAPPPPPIPDEQQLCLVNSLVHRAPAASAIGTTLHVVTYLEYQKLVYAGGWATMNAMTYAEFSEKLDRNMPVHT